MRTGRCSIWACTTLHKNHPKPCTWQLLIQISRHVPVHCCFYMLKPPAMESLVNTCGPENTLSSPQCPSDCSLAFCFVPLRLPVCPRLCSSVCAKPRSRCHLTAGLRFSKGPSKWLLFSKWVVWLIKCVCILTNTTSISLVNSSEINETNCMYRKRKPRSASWFGDANRVPTHPVENQRNRCRASARLKNAHLKLPRACW